MHPYRYDLNRLSLLAVLLFCGSFFGSLHTVTHKPLVASTSKSPLVSCNEIKVVKPIRMGLLESNKTRTGFLGFPVSFGWWDQRIRDSKFDAKLPLRSNENVQLVEQLLSETQGSLIDVGANVGFMTNLALAMNRTVYAIEPIQYNVAKLCEANRISYYQRHDHLHLYQAAAGHVSQPIVKVVRPSERYYDRASLTRINVPHPDVKIESVPMITVDSIVPDDETIALAKIDVQGHEYEVLGGMHRVLSRTKPRYILYESDFTLMEEAGHGLEQTRILVESYGYTCLEKETGDTLCRHLVQITDDR